jgi:hypothetical protein
MAYTQQDIFTRIKMMLPGQWFGEATPVLDSVVNALSAGWVGLFALIDYVRAQTRVNTAYDFWLDLIARDFFASRLIRRQRETDDSFRARIGLELIRDKCTRAAICQLLLDLTGRPPIIFEPCNPNDTGCYGALNGGASAVAGYGISGGWGNLNMPFQVLVRAFRPETAGIAMVEGWGGSIGGFGVGPITYFNLNINSSEASDDEIRQSIVRAAPAATVIWLSIQS